MGPKDKKMIVVAGAVRNNMKIFAVAGAALAVLGGVLYSRNR